MTEFIAPVKGITKALDTGTKLAKRVAKATGVASEPQAAQIIEAAKSLQESLEECARDITDAYLQLRSSCGEPFSQGLIEDQSIQQKLKELRIDLIDHINECQDYDEDEPDSFNRAAFSNLEQTSHECAIVCLEVFNGVRDRLLQDNLQKFKLGEKATQDGQPQSIPIRQMTFSRKPVPSAAGSLPKSLLSQSPQQASTSSLSIELPEPVKPDVNPWAIDTPPSQFSIGSPLSPNLGVSPQRASREVSPTSRPDGPISREIRHQREVIKFRVTANEEFLEKRRQSRLIFQHELRNSISSIDEYRASGTFSDGSIFSPGNGSYVTSPTQDLSRSPVSPINSRDPRTSANGYETLMTRQRSQGHASVTSRNSRSDSIVPDRLQRADSHASQDSIFGLRNAAPMSPPLSTHRASGTGNLATTLQLPGFGENVEDGIETVGRKVDHDNGLILANEGQLQGIPTPTSSLKTVEYPMRHDSSFYKFGGFCEGAKQMMKGEAGFKIVKRPSGHYGATLSAKCNKCSYEVGWNEVERDSKLDRAGIYGNCGIRWRQKFLSKCHVKTNSIDEPIYACVFCIDDHKTVEEHDATVFFSVPSLFRHLAKHSQPLPKIAGIKTLYGVQGPEVVDFDVHFTTAETRSTAFGMSEIAAKVATRPAGYANQTCHYKSTSSKSRDPDGNPVLQFAAGARIVGITFPERFGGTWCVGYHDGERGSFSASAITLELPLREDVHMNAQSSLVAYAKWDFKPKDAKDGGWLKLSRGDRITAVGYAFQDQWCWSGQNSKGKWGLFPSAFVENLQQDTLGTSPGNAKGVSRRIGSFPLPLGRKKSSRHERNGSGIREDSGGVPSLQSVQPGLEVVGSQSGGSFLGRRS